MSSRNFRLSDLPASVRDGVMREKSRELGRGIPTVPQPAKEVKPCTTATSHARSTIGTATALPAPCAPVASKAAPTSHPAALRTFYRASALYAAVKEVQAERQPKDMPRTRHFTTGEAACDWIYETIRDEQKRLCDMSDAVMDLRAKYAANHS